MGSRAPINRFERSDFYASETIRQAANGHQPRPLLEEKPHRQFAGWHPVTANHLIKADGCELMGHKRADKTPYWTAIVPSTVPGRRKFLKLDNGQFETFPTLAAAMEAIEIFMDIRAQFRQTATQDTIDMTARNICPPGGGL